MRRIEIKLKSIRRMFIQFAEKYHYHGVVKAPLIVIHGAVTFTYEYEKAIAFEGDKKMGIYQSVRFQGERGGIEVRALMDTGAEVSMIPESVAITIGAWLTGQNLTVTGVHGQAKTLPLGIAYIYFPSLNNIGGQFPVVISDVDQEIIIGMDIMRPLGISIDTQSLQVSVKSEVWDAFSTLAGIGVLVWGGIKTLEAISEKK